MATIPKLRDVERRDALRWLAERLTWERALAQLRSGEFRLDRKAA